MDLFLSAQTEEVTRSRLKKLIEEGQVSVNGVTVTKAGESVKKGDCVVLQIPEATVYDVAPEDIPVDIVYEDDELAVVNKPQGMTVHIGNGTTRGTLVNALLFHLESLSGIGGVLRPGIVHRIDKDTTGLLVVAKTDRAHVSLARQIAGKSCKRTYFALLEGNVKTEEGRIVTDIGRHPTDRLKMAVLPDGRGKIAITDYRAVLHFDSEYTLCQFDLQTGRTHQIRVHAKHIGHPVVGDPTYGYKKQKIKTDGQLLHAWRLELTHPKSGERMAFYAPLPEPFAGILQKLCERYGEEKEKVAYLYAENHQGKTE